MAGRLFCAPSQSQGGRARHSTLPPNGFQEGWSWSPRTPPGFVSTPGGQGGRGSGTEFWENTEKSVVCSPEAGQTPTRDALSLGAGLL